MWRVLGTLAVLGVATVADASCRVVRHAHVVDVVQVVQPIAVAAFVQVPAYGVGYGQDNTELLKRIDSLQLEIQKLRANPYDGLKRGPEALKEHPGAAVLTAKCASCHSGKGKGGFTLSLGKMSDKDHFRIAKEVLSGRMPKGGKLTDDEVSKVSQYLDTLK